ncbi:hypothetical protein SH661x_002896 [Planctomicrobium sp. SH661]|uniref:hypothetical protein n=1 Tax=Planctomicrobium sp. SH661 TaxID=3448124 RepID=UPI003F5BF468
MYLRDAGPSEVGAFGISDPDDVLCVREIQLVRQVCTEVTVKFDDLSVAEYFENQVDQGRTPEQCGRIWIHTHPGSCPQPSSVDVETFQRCFGRCDWAVMFILARNDSTYAQLHWRQGNAQLPMRVEIDYSQPFDASAFTDWEEEYLNNVLIPEPFQGDRVHDGRYEDHHVLADWPELEAAWGFAAPAARGLHETSLDTPLSTLNESLQEVP